MSDLSRALADITQLFNRLNISYVVMGGIAVRVYGIARPTYDIDVTIALGRDRLPELYQAVRELGYSVPEAYGGGWVDQVGGMPLVKVRLFLPAGGVDVDLFLAESKYQDQLLARRRHVSVDDLSVWLVSPEDLILLKLIAGRPRDFADIGDVLFTQGQLDENYMHQWADRLSVRAELERVLSEPPGV